MAELSEVADFLAGTVPFSFLSRQELEKLAKDMRIAYYARDTVVAVQDQTPIEEVSIILRGALELQADDPDDGGHDLGLLDVGDAFGALSILRHDSIALRTARAKEDTFVYVLPKTRFLGLCGRCQEIADYFTDLFGERMMAHAYGDRQRTFPRQIGLFYRATVAEACNETLLRCSADTSAREAASRMCQRQQNAVLVTDAEGQDVGIVTDADLRAKIVAAGCDGSTPVAEVMTPEPVTAAMDCPIIDAVLLMVERNIKHLPVVDKSGRIQGMFSDQSMLFAQGSSPLNFVRAIRRCKRLADLGVLHQRLPRLVRALMTEGVPVATITRLISTVSDAILDRVVTTTIDELGEPPRRFAVLILGSEGRREQTLATDQDNAIVYAESDNGDDAAADKYFRRLGNLICDRLADAGFRKCKGEVMAANQRWCQPLSSWREYFRQWVRVPEKQALMHASVFFDFRRGFGDEQLVRELRAHCASLLRSRADRFFYWLARNACELRPPLGFFRTFVVASKGDHRNTLDLKKPVTNLVDFVRLYALANEVQVTGTLERLTELVRRQALTATHGDEIEQAYNYLMQLRLLRQETAILDEGREADNQVDPDRLTRLEQRILREIFRTIERLQGKLSLEFPNRE